MTNESRQEDEEVREDNFVRNLRIGLAIPFGILQVFFLIAGLYSFVEPTTPSDKKDFVQAIGVLIAGFAGVVGLFFTWRNLALTRENTEKQLRATRENTERQLQAAREAQERTQDSAQKTLQLTEQGQITERFTRAIDQLGETDDKGNPKIEIRLGGIYALERISKDSPKRDYSTVMEVLSAYVRQNTSIHSKESNEATEKSDVIKEPRADIKAVLDVLGRRQEEHVPEEYRVRPDLRKINLSKANLTEANLSGVNLEGANFEEANLTEANLSGVNLEGANFEEANLSGAILIGASLFKANLTEASLFGANLTEANLFKANLFKAFLQQANFEEAHLAEVNLSGAILIGANLTKAFLFKANLSGALLLVANFSGAFLPQANLTKADLRAAKEALQVQLEQALGDKTTQLPRGLERPRSWEEGKNKQTEGDE